MLNWDDLRYFVALADSGSLAAAARRLRVEHATIARRIAALEEKLGAALVDRRGRRYVLTDEGMRVATQGRAMEEAALAVERGLAGARQDRIVDLSLSAPPLVTRLVAAALPRLMEAQPGLRLTLLGQSRTVSLIRREADLALRLARPDNDDLILRKIGALAYRLYGTRDYLKGRKPGDCRFIAFDESLDDLPQQNWLRTQMQAIAGDGSVTGRAIVMRSNDLGTQAAAAAAGLGLAVLPRFVADELHLKQAFPREAPFLRDIWLTYHRDLRKNSVIPAIASFLAGVLPQEKE